MGVADAEMTFVIAADPGLPSRRATAIRDEVREALSSQLGAEVAVELTTSRLMELAHGDIDPAAARRIAEEYDRCDGVIVLTEVPRRTRGQPLMAEVFHDDRVAVISCPTLGAWATRHRIQRVVVSSVVRMVPNATGADAGAYDTRWSRWTERPQRGSAALHAHTFTGAPRLVLGMVAANEPARTAPHLSGALAAATATAAFGVFYSSIWRMADALSPLRLVLIAAMAIVAMVAWLLFSNRLWDRAVNQHVAAVVLLYNMSTVLTLLIVVSALLGLLFVVILAVSALVIDPSFMGEVIGEDAQVGHYVRLALLAASMGVVAGALGSNFDAEADLRQLTHGQRERARVREETAD